MLFQGLSHFQHIAGKLQIVADELVVDAVTRLKHDTEVMMLQASLLHVFTVGKRQSRVAAFDIGAIEITDRLR